MAIGDFQQFKDHAYNAFVNTIQQQYELWNGATNNALVLTTDGAFGGDYKQKAAFESLASLVGNRDPSSTAAASEHALAELLGVDVKLGYGTPNVSYTNTSFDWTQRDPAQAGTLFGNDVAQGAMLYKLNSVLAMLVASMQSDVTYDGTAGTASLASLNSAASKFGDRQSAITCWIMHSKSINDIYGTALANSNRLFEFGTVQVIQDGFGRPLIMTDSESLHFDNSGTENYHQLGLVSGAATVSTTSTPRIFTEMDLSKENAKMLMKTEGDFSIGVKGVKWNTAVTKPNDAAIANSANVPRISGVGLKDTAGVMATTL